MNKTHLDKFFIFTISQNYTLALTYHTKQFDDVTVNTMHL